MRIRPVFWWMLAFVCCAVLVFAGAIREHTPAVMQVRVDKAVPVSVGYTTVELHLSDPQNIPIEQAQVIPTCGKHQNRTGTPGALCRAHRRRDCKITLYSTHFT